MTTYNVIGDAFTDDSPSLQKDKPPYFEIALNTAEFAPDGFGYSVRYSRDEVILEGGYARLYDGSQAWHIFTDGNDTLALETDSGTNYVYVAYDVSDNQVYYEVKTTETEPSDPALKTLEIDAANQTEERTNRKPIVAFGSTNYTDEGGNAKQEIKYDPQLDTLVLIKYD